MDKKAPGMVPSVPNVATAKSVEKKAPRIVKGVEYEIVGDAVVLHVQDSEPISLPLELGKSAYAVAYSYLNRKTGTKVRGGNGIHVVGNFKYQVNEDGSLAITRPSGDVITHVMTPEEAKYPRTTAVTVLLKTLE